MTQQVTVEIQDDLSPEHAEQLAQLLRDVAASDGRSRVRLEIEADAVLGLAPIQPDPVDDEEPVDEEDEAPAEDDGPPWPPSLNPDTRKWTLATLLYSADEPQTVSEVVELSGETVDQSVASAGLYKMHQEHLVEREGTPFAYQLTPDAVGLLEERAREEDVSLETPAE